MAHGGHVGRGHSHFYARRMGIFWNLVFVILIVGILLISSNKSMGIGPLEGQYKKYEYLIDDEAYFYNTQDMIEGLKYWHQKTNVQIVVISAKGLWSDAKAEEKYNEMFDDEAHILIICPTAWYTSNTYYAVGDLAKNVADDGTIYRLIRQIHKIKNGSEWKKELIYMADSRIKEEE